MRTISKISFLVLTFAFSASLITSCDILGSKTSGDLSNTGVSGKVIYGPTSPVVIEGHENSIPYQADIHVIDGAENLVHSFSTDEEGNFQVILEPGNYILMPQVEQEGDIVPSWPRSRPYNVQVNIGSFTEIEIYYDSGIR